MNPGQGPKTPDCGCTHGEDKHYPDQLIRHGSLAPALEHRDESDHEQQDCTRTQSLKPHARSPFLLNGPACHPGKIAGSARVTHSRDSVRGLQQPY
jgi:hypothetical protein